MSAVKRIDRFLPIVALARGYRAEDLPRDLVAGAVLAVVTVPQAIAYAFLAGLPAEAGLYACLAPVVAYALFSSSRQLVVGPVAIAALMVQAAISEHAPAFSQQYLGIATVLSLEAGLLLLLLRLLRMGDLVDLLSHPVTAGFVNAAAVLIIVSQLGPFLGLAAKPGEGVLAQLVAIGGGIRQIDAATLLIGASCLLLLFLVRRYAPRLVGGGESHPIGRVGPVLVAVLGTLAVLLWQLDVAVVGVVPAGLPALAAPVFDAALWWALAPDAALIALVAYVEGCSVGRSLAARQQQRLDSNQELTALGAANLAAAFSGAYPVAASFTRSGVNYAAGARTPLSALFCAALILVALLWLTPLFAHLPRAALAAIVVASVWGLLDFHSLRANWRFYRADVIAHFATFAGVLVAGVEAGLLLGVLVSIVLFLRSSSRPHMAVLGRLGDSAHFRNVERFDVRTLAHVVAVRVDESVYFANAERIETRLRRLLEDSGGASGHLLLVMSAVNFIDASGLAMLKRLSADLRREGAALHLCEIKGPVRDQLAHVALDSWLSGRVFATTEEAFDALAEAP